MTMMSSPALIELARRFVSLVALVAGTVCLINGLPPIWWIALLASGAAVYLLVPRPVIPREAIRYEKLPAIYMPDLLGFFLGVTLFGLPFVVADQVGPEVIWFLFFMLFLPGVASLGIFIIAARYATSWVVIADTGLTVSRFGLRRDLPYGDIVSARWRERRLPHWVSVLLVMFGGAQGAGTALLHGRRPTHTIVLECGSGDALISADSLLGLKRLEAALESAGVPWRKGDGSLKSPGEANAGQG
jgi:hypothetical protein